jgi:2-C-methyl-D-erythritol 2,4-cyclodiphosphate synthase
MRIGHGYDVHRTKPGDSVTLGGVKIPAPFALLAHSDGDVLVHAVIDSLFGATGLPDIGTHFPDTDEQYKEADSLRLLSETCRIIRKNGFEIEYIDTTIIAQRPKMAPHIQQMRSVMSEAAGIHMTQINVKATTEEKLGFTGSEEGIAAHAVCLLRK